MKTAILLAALFAAFALVGTVDYQTAAALAGEYSPTTLATAAGDQHGTR